MMFFMIEFVIFPLWTNASVEYIHQYIKHNKFFLIVILITPKLNFSQKILNKIDEFITKLDTQNDQQKLKSFIKLFIGKVCIEIVGFLLACPFFEWHFYYTILKILGWIALVISIIAILNILATRQAYRPFKKLSDRQVPVTLFEDIIKDRKKYQVQHFEVETSDGYILTMHRVRLTDEYKSKLMAENAKNIDKPVLLVHGFGSCSITYFIGGSERSPGHYFVNRGFDVWVANQRGTKFSLKHKNPDIPLSDYFSFSADEGGCLDIPAYYTHILSQVKLANPKIILVGLSMGGLQSIMALSDEKSSEFVNKHTERAVLLVPLIYYSYATCESVGQYPISVYETYKQKSEEFGIYHSKLGDNEVDRTY